MSEEVPSRADTGHRGIRQRRRWRATFVALTVVGAIVLVVASRGGSGSAASFKSTDLLTRPASKVTSAMPSDASANHSGVASAVVSAPAASASGIEVCGFGITPTDEEGKGAYEREVEAAFQLAAKRLHAALLKSTRPESLAIGRLLAIQDAATPPRTLDRDERCDDADETCLARSKAERAAAYEQASRTTRDALVQLALDTHDAFAYGLAVEACGTAREGQASPEGKCQLVTLEAWSRLDAGNMVPWLARASVAFGRGDKAAMDEAYHQASLADDYRVPTFAMVGIADAEMTTGYEPFERLSAQMELFGTAMASPLLSAGGYSRYCTVEAVRDANRYQVCDRLTTSLMAHGPDLLTRRIALNVAEKRLGWPAAKTTAMRLEVDLLSDRSMRLAADETNFGCANMSRLTAQLARRSRLGELAAMRLELAESGESREQALAANLAWRDTQRRRAATEEAAASAALAASTPYSATPPPAR